VWSNPRAEQSAKELPMSHSSRSQVWITAPHSEKRSSRCHTSRNFGDRSLATACSARRAGRCAGLVLHEKASSGPTRGEPTSSWGCWSRPARRRSRPARRSPRRRKGYTVRARVARTCSDSALAPSGAPMGLRGGALPTDRKAHASTSAASVAIQPGNSTTSGPRGVERRARYSRSRAFSLST